ncbi:hypothetical protein HPO96_12565 [Kribbella sandramycini]|uniref:Uncharacterized protein n=1 Tax=Kribbella sandramycini TaxID=60450 RepID=A0A7Y4NYZ5_9ACTN|nr:hypothetical protein [Kribbella sandramycini]MBB6569080.1 hypothetical protein [Kribbella sandramycini]NOL41076.1 hypothetical protein [Kribbella sandramycini]
MLRARSLIEAQVYESVLTAADESVPAVPPPGLAGNLAEGETAWTYASTVGEIEIPYAAEDASRKLGVPFGLGVSTIMDAALWVVLSGTFARRALTADMSYTGQPGQDRSVVELNWEYAAYAVREAIKFLPEDADQVPESAVWSEYGRRLLAESPQMLFRAKLFDDLAYYEGTLADFRALYDGPSSS